MDNPLRSIVFRTRLVRLLLACLLLLPAPVLAYLDPTTGSMVISAIVGLFASLVLAVKTYWYKLRALFGRKVPDTDSDDEPV